MQNRLVQASALFVLMSCFAVANGRQDLIAAAIKSNDRTPLIEAGVTEVLAELVETDSPEKQARALSDLQAAVHLQEALSCTGFARVPAQIESLCNSFTPVREAWSRGELSVRNLRDARKLWEVLAILRAVSRDLARVVPRTEYRLTTIGDVFVAQATAASGGPLMAIGAARRLAAVYRNHAGAKSDALVEGYFSDPSRPLFLGDFNHYSFARHLGLTVALGLADSFPLPDSLQREILFSLWATSFVDTAIQLNGLRLAGESPSVVRALYQAWARQLVEVPNLKSYLLQLVETLAEVKAQRDQAVKVNVANQAVEILMQEILVPRAQRHYGMVAAIRARVNEMRANALHLNYLAKYFDQHLPGGTEAGTKWLSVSTGARVTSFICGGPARACALVASVPLVPVEWVVGVGNRLRDSFVRTDFSSGFNSGCAQQVLGRVRQLR